MLKDAVDIFKDHPRCHLSDCRYALGLPGTPSLFLSSSLESLPLALILPLVKSLESSLDISKYHIIIAGISA